MGLIKQFYDELTYLKEFNISSIMISTTAKHALEFRVLPRRSISNMGISSFMINDETKLEETLSFFDGNVDNIYIDVEQKQFLNLFEIARKIVKKSKVITVKPNDTTIESCDSLIRHSLNDDLYNKNIIVIGTGNLASKIAIRLAERQANVYIVGRTAEKEKKVAEAINLFLPKHTSLIKPIDLINTEKANVIVSFLSGQFNREEEIMPLITTDTLIIDGGINNFSSDFIKEILMNNVQITRLDTRIALSYQLLLDDDYTRSFFTDIFGQSVVQETQIVAGGYIGDEGTVIVDSIKNPNQIIGIADGSGGVKAREQLSEADRDRIQKIKKIISTSSQTNI